MSAMVAWGSAMAAHVVIDFVHVLFLVLPVILIATIPVSIAGWGVREGAMVLAIFLCRPDRERRFNHFHSFWRCEFGGGAIGGIVWVASGYRWRSVKKIEADTLAYDLSR
jgi:hypothetical protein